jgi:hypothetical protein
MPAEVWDGNEYCLECVAAAGLSGLSVRFPELEEVTEFGIRQALARGSLLGLYMATAFSLILVPSGLLYIAAISLERQIAGNPLNLGGEFHMLGLVIGVLWLFSTVLVFTIFVPTFLLARTRTLTVRDGQIHFATRLHAASASLSDCSWISCNRGFGVLGVHLPWQPIVQLKTSDYRMFVCGLQPETRQLWIGFFTLAGVRQLRPVDVRGWLLAALAGGCVGGGLGIAAGYLLSLLTGDPQAIRALTLLGSADGLAGGGYLQILAQGRTDVFISPKRHSAFGKWPAAILNLVSFAFVGFQIGINAGRLTALVCSLVNIAFACILGWKSHQVRRKLPPSAASAPYQPQRLDS